MILASSTGDYAIALLNKGYDVQNVSRMCKMPMDSVRLLAPARKPRNEYCPPSVAPVVPEPVETETAAPTPLSRREQMMADIEAVAQRYGLSAADLLGQSRKRPAAFARHEAMSVVKERWGLSNPRIGQMFGGRDPTTVLHALQSHADRIEWCAVVSAMARFT